MMDTAMVPTDLPHFELGLVVRKILGEGKERLQICVPPQPPPPYGASSGPRLIASTYHFLCIYIFKCSPKGESQLKLKK